MNKNELEYAKLQLNAGKFRESINLVKHLLSLIAVLAAIYLFFQGLSQLVGGKDEGSIQAIAKVIDVFKIGSVLGYIIAAGTSTAWALERKSKKRAIEEKSRYQNMIEAADANRTSSALDKHGNTPKGE